jgi:hypothetical protein
MLSTREMMVSTSEAPTLDLHVLGGSKGGSIVLNLHEAFAARTLPDAHVPRSLAGRCSFRFNPQGRCSDPEVEPPGYRLPPSAAL